MAQYDPEPGTNWTRVLGERKVGHKRRERDGSDEGKENAWPGEVRRASGSSLKVGEEGVLVEGLPGEISQQERTSCPQCPAECGSGLLDQLRSRTVGQMGGAGRIPGSQGKGRCRLERLGHREPEKDFQDGRRPQTCSIAGHSWTPPRDVPTYPHSEGDATCALLHRRRRGPEKRNNLPNITEA